MSDVLASPSDSDEWQSPQWLFDKLHALYDFTLDGAATAENAKLENFITKEMDATRLNVGDNRVWLNCPYSRGSLMRYVTWAREQAQAGALVCCLVPAYTCERWWQENIEHPDACNLLEVNVTRHTPELIFTVREYELLRVSVMFPPGRLKFVEAGGKTGPARFSSAVVVFEPPGGYQV